MAVTYPGATTYPGANTYPGTSPGGTALVGSGQINVVLDFQVSINPPAVTASSGLVQSAARFQFTATGSGALSTLPSIAAFPQPNNVPPRYLIQASNITGAATATVTRTDPDGTSTLIRLGDPAILNAGGFIGYDYEAPFNQPVTYTITAGPQVVVSPPVTLLVAEPWLLHPGVPDLSRPVRVKVLDVETKAASSGLHPVVGRKRPVPVSGGRRKAAVFQMLIKTDTAQERDSLDDLLDDEVPLLLQAVYGYTSESLYLWVQVGDVTTERRTSDFGDPARLWTLPCVAVDRPEGAVQAQRTWADVMAECGTWAEVMAKYATWRGVLTGVAGT